MAYDEAVGSTIVDDSEEPAIPGTPADGLEEEVTVRLPGAAVPQFSHFERAALTHERLAAERADQGSLEVSRNQVLGRAKAALKANVPVAHILEVARNVGIALREEELQ